MKFLSSFLSNAPPKHHFTDLKHIELAMICAIVPYAILSFLMDESPRWLLTRGREKEAKKIIEKILKMNKLPQSNLNLIKPIEDTVKKRNIIHVLAKKVQFRISNL